MAKKPGGPHRTLATRHRQAGPGMGSVIAPLSYSPSSLQEGATLVHTAVLGNQVIPSVGRRHLPLSVSTACRLCFPLPPVL